MTGYPDWQTYPQWTGVNAFAANSVAGVTGTIVLYQGVTPAFASTDLRVAPSAGYGIVSAAWYTDPALTQRVGFETFSVNSAFQLNTLLPVRGPYLKVTLQVTSVAPMTADTYMTGFNMPVAAPMPAVNTQVVQAFGVVVPAGADNIMYVPFLCAGPAMLFFRPSASPNSLQAFVEVTDQSGAVIYRLAEIDMPTAGVNVLMQAPFSPIRLRVHNQAVSTPNTFSAALVIAPRT